MKKSSIILVAFAGFEQLNVYQRGASRASELRGRAPFTRLLLQPEERPTSRAHSRAGGPRERSAVSSHDV